MTEAIPDIIEASDDRTVFEKTDASLAPSVKKLPVGDLLLPYQANAIKAMDTANVLFIVKSRRIGLTWGVAGKAGLTAAASKKAGGMDVYYMGYEKDMAREFIDVCGMWLKAFNVAAGDVDEFVFQPESDGEKEIKAFRISLPSGFEIVALPSKPRAFRGKQGLVILDEAAFMEKVEETIDSAMALLMWGGSVIVISTHYGIDNPFNKKLEEVRADPKKGQVIQITFDDAINDGLYERVALVSTKAILPKDEWIADIRAKYGKAASQELDCIPMQGGLPWIDVEDYNACLHDDADKPELYQKGLCFVGYDVARSHDGIIVWTLEEVGQVLWLRERWEQVDQRFSIQYAAFDSVFARYRVSKAAIDATGMGSPVFERHEEKHGASRIEGHVPDTGSSRRVGDLPARSLRSRNNPDPARLRHSNRPVGAEACRQGWQGLDGRPHPPGPVLGGCAGLCRGCRCSHGLWLHRCQRLAWRRRR